MDTYDLDIALLRVRGREGFSYLHREQSKPMHPILKAAIELVSHTDELADAIVAEWPHVASDGTSVAYTQTPDKGNRNLQTRTSPGKYLRRMFPSLGDHQIRDLVALGADGEFNIVRSMPKIIEVIAEGPRSCMSGTKEQWEEEYSRLEGHHPYEVYAPHLGWGMAYFKNNEGRYDGRALVLERDGAKYFVRSYKRCFDGYGNEAYSHAHEGLEAWLVGQGYRKIDGWPTHTKLARISICGGDYVVMPYIDGDMQCVIDDGDYMLISHSGADADSTSGYISVEAPGVTCHECGETHDEDDSVWAGYSEDHRICEHCQEHHFVQGIGRNRRSYWFRESSAVRTSGGEVYHEDYLDDNGMLLDAHGDVIRQDEAVEVDDEWYHIDDDAIVRCADDEWRLRTLCSQCEHDGEWYRDEDMVGLGPYGVTMVAQDNLDEFLIDNPEQVPRALDRNYEVCEAALAAYAEHDPEGFKARGLALTQPDQIALPIEPEIEHAA